MATQASAQKENSSANEFVISRTYAAPAKTLFEAWTVPEKMARWWGPKGFTVGSYTMDLRPGGVYHYGMQAPDGKPLWGKFVYREIKAPEKLVYVNNFADAHGNTVRHPFNLKWPMELLSTITFIEKQGKTEVTIRWTPLNATSEEEKTFVEGMAGMQLGWAGTLEQLQDYLATGK